MPVLLLAQGDPASKLLLRHAIEARYGLGPPALETLTLALKGRQRSHVGPLSFWSTLDSLAYFKFPMSVRWSLTVRAFGVAFANVNAAFDGEGYYSKRGSKITTESDPNAIHAGQAQVWALSALFLTPLSEEFVELRAIDDLCLDATHTHADVTACLQLNEDYTLAAVSTEYINPQTRKRQTFTIDLPEGQAMLGDLILPSKLILKWDDQPQFEFSFVSVTTNDPLDDALFRLEHD